jgi:hypothetical protein
MILAIAGCNLQLEPTSGRGAVEKLAPTAVPAPQAVVAALEAAYETRDHAHFEALLAEDFLFIPEMDGSWGRVEESRIHRRMFDPAEVPPGNPPVPPDLWLQSVDVTLTPQTKWMERPDLYASPTNPNGLDPAAWYVANATYSTQVFFQMQGDTDFLVEGRAVFVVMVERAVGFGASWRSYLYRWEDLGSSAQKQQRTAVEPASWSDVKGLYR